MIRKGNTAYGTSESNTKIKIAELDDYYKLITGYASEGSKDVRFQNEERAHNAVVMQVIFEKATKVKMYCGEFSIFRTGFKKKVNESIDFEGENVDEKSPMTNLYNSLESFLKRDNTSLDVIVEDPGIVFWTDFYSLKNLYSYIVSRKINFHVFKEGFSNFSDAYHFTVGDKRMYRRESDRVKHNAICGFNNSAGAEILLTRFEQLKENTIPMTEKILLPQLMQNTTD